MSHYPEDGPPDRERAKAHVKELRLKPEHKAKKGDPRDEATRDDPQTDLGYAVKVRLNDTRK